MLPKNVLDRAHPDPEDLPIEKEVSGLAELSGHIPPRDNSNLLKLERDSWGCNSWQTNNYCDRRPYGAIKT